jgi:hypothetical protein
VLALVEIPEHSNTVLAARSSERAVRGDGHGIDVASVPIVVGLQLEF